MKAEHELGARRRSAARDREAEPEVIREARERFIRETRDHPYSIPSAGLGRQDMRNDVCRHEASHAAVAITLGRRVAHLERDPGDVLAGKQLGHARIPLDERIDVSQVPIAIAGYLSEGHENWPPLWPD